MIIHNYRQELYSSGNELFFAALYLLFFSEGPNFGGYGLFRSVVIVCAPVMFFKVSNVLVPKYLNSLLYSIVWVELITTPTAFISFYFFFQ